MKSKIFESEHEREIVRGDSVFGGNTFAVIGALALSFRGMVQFNLIDSGLGNQVSMDSAVGLLLGLSAYHYYKAFEAAHGVIAAELPDLEDILPVTLVLTDEQLALLNPQPLEYPPLRAVPPLKEYAA